MPQPRKKANARPPDFGERRHMWICREKNLENSAYHVWDGDYAFFVSIWPSGGVAAICFLGARLGYSFYHDFFSHYGSFLCFHIFNDPKYTPSFLSTCFISLNARFPLSSCFISLPYSRLSFFVSRFMTMRACARLLRLTMFTV